MSLEGLQLPEKGMTMLHNLAMNVRSLCMDTLFQRASRGTQRIPISLACTLESIVSFLSTSTILWDQ